MLQTSYPPQEMGWLTLAVQLGSMLDTVRCSLNWQVNTARNGVSNGRHVHGART